MCRLGRYSRYECGREHSFKILGLVVVVFLSSEHPLNLKDGIVRICAECYLAGIG